MKKTIILALIIICITATVSVALDYHETVTKSNLSDTAKSLIEDYVANTSNIKSPEHFKSIVDCYDKAAIENISDYINFIYQNRFNYSELKVINRILENGTTIQSLEQAYEFWLTTDESFDFIEQMCLLESTFVSEFWYENAFDMLTEYEHGVLESDKILHYQKLGVTIDQILAANVMSRKRGQNIEKILSEYLDGISLEEYAKKLYNTNNLPQFDSLAESVTHLAKESKRPAVYKISQKQREELTKIIRDKITSAHQIRALKQTNSNSANDLTLLKDVQYPSNIQKALLNKGYTPEEIVKASKLPGNNIFDSVKKAREMMKNEK